MHVVAEELIVVLDFFALFFREGFSRESAGLFTEFNENSGDCIILRKVIFQNWSCVEVAPLLN